MVVLLKQSGAKGLKFFSLFGGKVAALTQHLSGVLD
jgi:hypothetical protein